MYESIDQLCRRNQGIETIIDRTIQEKWIHPVEKRGIQYLSRTDIYKLRFIFHLRSTGVAWKEIPQHLRPGHLFSIELPGEG